MLRVKDYVLVSISFALLIVFFLVFSDNFYVGAPTDVTTKGIDADIVINRGNNIQTSKKDYKKVVVLTGTDKNIEITNNVEQLMTDLKIGYEEQQEISRLSDEQKKHVETIILTMNDCSKIKNQDELFSLVEEGKSLIVTNTNFNAKNNEFLEKIGIMKMSSKQKIDGIILFNGLTTQDFKFYFKYPMSVNVIRTDAFSKTLITEYSKKEKKVKDRIPLLWERRSGTGKIFVLNNDFIERGCGDGILTGVMAQTQDSFAYPVINAKCELITDFPDYFETGSNLLQKRYSRSQPAVMRDIFWPSLEKIIDNFKLRASIYAFPTEKDLKNNDYIYLKNKIQNSGNYFYENEQVAQDSTIVLPGILNDFKNTDKNEFSFVSQVTSRALAVHRTDMRRVVTDTSKQYEWSSYTMELSDLMSSIFGDAKWVDAVSAQEAMERYKKYLVLQPKIQISKRSISIQSDGFFDKAYYMLRTNQSLENKEVEGKYSIKKVSDNYYLITVYKENVKIQTK